MQAVIPNTEKPNEIAVIKKMKDYSNEPVFKKKAEKATALLKEYPLPESFIKKHK